jgi:integrase
VPLHVVRRPDTQTLQITGIVALPDGRRIQVRRRAASDTLRLATEEAAAIEARLLRDAWHGERRGSRSYAEAVDSWLSAAPRGAREQAHHLRILQVVGDLPLAQVDQEAVNRVKGLILRPDASPATILRAVITPIRSVLNYAAGQGWCTMPRLVKPRQPVGRTRFLLPDEMDRLLAAAAPHLVPLMLFLVDTGARLSEAIELDWQDVDLLSAPRVNFIRTKNNRPRSGVALSPRTVAALAGLPHRDGPVFRTQKGLPYADKERQEGGQIKTGFRRAVERAGLLHLTPHDLRHTWASWHYAQHRDLLRLKQEGGWSSVALVERYAHLMPAGFGAEIGAFWGFPCTLIARANQTAGLTH